MSSAALNSIVGSTACRGAFRLNGDEIEPIKAGPKTMGEAAARTRDLWASVGPIVSDAGLMIAKRDDAMSVASPKGGLIIEASGPINIGILRAALQNETAVQPAALDATSALAPGPLALVSLAQWIADIEAPRALEINAGDTPLRLWARKGKFGLAGGSTAADIAACILNAGANNKPITLEYGSLGGDVPDMCYDPISFFTQSATDEANWVIDETGIPTAGPESARLEDAIQAMALAHCLKAWSTGTSFEVSVLDGNRQTQVIARAEDPHRILLSTSTLYSSAV